MPNYIYKARDKSGALLTGTVGAADEIAVATNLRKLGYSVISIERESELKLRVAGLWQRRKRACRQELLFFTRQLSTMLKSGISLMEALMGIAQQTRHKLFRETIESVRKDIEAGVTFSDALSKHPRVFSELFISMVRVGEAAGILDDVLERLTILGTQELEVRTRIQSALTYPVILVTVAVLVVSFLLINIIPKFVVVFETYEAKLPLPTQILLGVSFALRRLWLFLIIGLGLFILWFRRYLKTEKGRYKFDSYLLKMPLFGQLYLKLMVSRFARTFGALTTSGVSILEALSVTEKTVTNKVITRIIQNIRDAITEGESLAEPFRVSGVFPPMVIQMVSAGEKTGKLDQMLSDVATFYDQEVEYTVRNITTVLEPLLLLGMGVMVAFIALSVLLPIFNLIKVFRH